MASLTHMERAVPCAMQRSTAASTRQMHMVAPRMAFVKATPFSAAAKSVESRSAITKVGSRLQLLNQNIQLHTRRDTKGSINLKLQAAFSVNAQVVASDVM
jgi:hypothetical protein